jgi:hypothetical protein
MIDKIFEMIMEEARSRGGDDLSWSILDVVNEVLIKIMDKFEELNEHFLDWMPDDMEELGKRKNLPLFIEQAKKHKRGEKLT